MAQDITIANAQYNDVPSIEVPKQGGGTASFVDTSDADAIASEIDMGKTAYVNGVKLTGTRSGGGSYSAGDGIDISNDTISLETASTTDIGGVIVGSGLSIDANGVLSAIGGGTPYTETVLFSNASGVTSGTINLSGNISDYDLIQITATFNYSADTYYFDSLVTSSELLNIQKQNKYKTANTYNNSHIIDYSVDGDNAIYVEGQFGDVGLSKVVGIKFGGGSSLASQIASLEARIQALESQLS